MISLVSSKYKVERGGNTGSIEIRNEQASVSFHLGGRTMGLANLDKENINDVIYILQMARGLLPPEQEDLKEEEEELPF